VTAIVWYRRDLRLDEHPALHAALGAHEAVVPVYCLDDRLLAGRHRSGPRTQFLLECLRDLDGALRERGSALVLRHGRPELELAMLCDELRVDEVHVTAEVTPFAVRRDARVKAALERRGVALRRHAGLGVVDDLTAPRTRAGEAYTTFSPFHRSWLQEERRAVLDPPSDLPALPTGLRRGRVPSLRSLGLGERAAAPLPGGARPARARLKRFLEERVERYAEDRDRLVPGATSRLSPYIHFGCVSAREIESRLGAGRGSEAFRRQLAWRDFNHHLIAHHPRNATVELQARYRGNIRWSRSRAQFEAWCDGRTGYPLVDAAMRQLRREGWMHNRARLVAGSFLTKDLGIDWRWGERHFMRWLLDGDQANNNGNWQWVASVGSDPQPAFRRIYSPTRQMAAHDPDGSYVRRHVPELAGVPDEYLREPWTMPRAVQRRAGCVIGEDYPAPIVDHAWARREALERYRLAS